VLDAIGCSFVRSIIKVFPSIDRRTSCEKKTDEKEMSRSLLNIAKRPLPRLTLRDVR
jgi:hypothetical protein